MFLIFLFSCASSGAFACSDAQCRTNGLQAELATINYLPDQQQLRTLCRTALPFFQCRKDYNECIGEKLEDLANSSDIEKKIMARATLGALSLAHDFCHENSTLYHDYIRSLRCIRDFIVTKAIYFRQEIILINARFVANFNRQDGDYREIGCLHKALTIMLLIDGLGETCGSGAQRAVITAMEKLTPAVTMGDCVYRESFRELQSKILDFMELESGKRRKYPEIFNAFTGIL